MKTFAAIFGFALSITSIAQAGATPPPAAANRSGQGLYCRITEAPDDHTFYLTVRMNGEYKVPTVTQTMDLMNANPGLFAEMNTQRIANKTRTHLFSESLNSFKQFYFNGQPSRTGHSQTVRCPTRFATDYDCFDTMIKTGRSRNPDGSYTSWNIPEGRQSEYWTFARRENVSALLAIGNAMNCKEWVREDQSVTVTANAPEAPAAPAPAAPAAAPAADPAAAPAPVGVNRPAVSAAMSLGPAPGAVVDRSAASN